MIKYPKINSVFKRDDLGNFTDQFSQPEFEYLYNNEWVGTEKIDGTNLRIHWNGDTWELKGRTDKAQIPESLLVRINEIFTPELKGNRADAKGYSSLLANVFGKVDTYDENKGWTSEEDFLDVTLFGEGYGLKIQKGGARYIPNGVDFILFDVKIGPYWLKREDVIKIAQQLGIKVVPTIVIGTLKEMIDYVRWGFKSKVAQDSDFDAEGLVLTPKVDLLARNGSRIITKLKTKDFQ